MIKLTLTEKNGEPRLLTFDKDEITIGRVSGNDIVLAKGNVSKRHSRFTVKSPGQIEVADLKSTNGTYVNGRKIGSPMLLSASDPRLRRRLSHQHRSRRRWAAAFAATSRATFRRHGQRGAPAADPAASARRRRGPVGIGRRACLDRATTTAARTPGSAAATRTRTSGWQRGRRARGASRFPRRPRRRRGGRPRRSPAPPLGERQPRRRASGAPAATTRPPTTPAASVCSRTPASADDESGRRAPPATARPARRGARARHRRSARPASHRR